MKCQLIIVVSLVDDICTKVDGKMRHGHMQINYNHMTKSHKKLSCDRETSLCFVSLNILLSHSRSFEMTLLSRARVSPYY